MTTEASPKPPPDGRYRPTVSIHPSALLSQLSFIAESPNENEADLVEFRQNLRFETDCNTPVLTILKRFLEQLLLLDSKAYLLSKDHKRHFLTAADLPQTPTELQKAFPATILNRRSGNRLVLRLTISSTKSFLELTQFGIVTWANRNKLRLETDVYYEDDVRDCLWIAGRDSKTSKPILHRYLTATFATATFDSEEIAILNTYKSKHNLQPHELPPFSLYWRNRIGYNNLSTQALVLRCDATAKNFFVKFLTRANKCGTIPETKGRFIPLSVTKNNEVATKRAMDGQNKYLTCTTSIPITGLSFESLNTEIEVADKGKTTIESIIYQHCLSLEPTAKSEDLGRFNLICPTSNIDSTLEFINRDIPIMWSLLPDSIAKKFQESHQISCPRVTAGYSGSAYGSVTLEDPQSVGTEPTAETEWTQPPNSQRPPRYVSVIYKDNDDHPPTHSAKDNKHKTTSDKSHATAQSESELSTLVTSIREEMTKELQAHTDLITSLKEEISQLRTHQDTVSHTAQTNNPSLSAIQEEHKNVILSLRHEMQELRKSIPTRPASIPDITSLITSIVENMVPLITAAVRQGLDSDTADSSKRSRVGGTPNHLRTANIQPINLLHSFPPESPRDDQSPTFNIPDPTLKATLHTSPTSNSALRSEDMEE